jgi:hypothetical protein
MSQRLIEEIIIYARFFGAVQAVSEMELDGSMSQPRACERLAELIVEFDANLKAFREKEEGQ